jgi:hypothetical protein
MARRATTTQMMVMDMRVKLRTKGYECAARFVRGGIEVGCNLDDSVVMVLHYPDSTTPDAAVAKTVSVLDKLNGIKR